ncbi:MAG: hypothetical protein DWQ42_16920 [Planctomycetota bacterium]|nr:MAG: hypothetical protein DWQ42_16920 [Planctomycetota bacterium]REK40761.1 MAG: hypothetical protein DWQ46_15435 [Planctomycetota bacterium]
MKLNRSTRRSIACALLIVALAAAAPPAARAQLDFDRAPINYASAVTDDRVARLQKRLDAGEVRLEYEEGRGYLRSVLRELGVPVSSQMLVFSKTSFQLRRISPRAPRALYFSDDVYVGWVQNGDVMEVTAVDPEQGAVFYTLQQEDVEQPKFVRDRGNCLSCHASARTQGVPGHVVRSVYPAADGQPHFGSGTFNTDQSSPLKERWGGWYVTGTHGEQRHMGNAISHDRDRPELLDMERGANLTELTGRIRTKAYLTPHSDIVALMVLEHQTTMHNLITRANYETRIVRHDARIMNRVLERPEDFVSEAGQRRIRTACEKLLEYLLFVDEAELTDPIEGTSGFAAEFESLGPRDAKGRSLRELDLSRRMMKYPCSYLIYSEAFNKLPEVVKTHLYDRLWEVLQGEDTSEEFAHLSPGDRRAISEILRDTKPDLAAHWQRRSAQR